MDEPTVGILPGIDDWVKEITWYNWISKSGNLVGISQRHDILDLVITLLIRFFLKEPLIPFIWGDSARVGGVSLAK